MAIDKDIRIDVYVPHKRRFSELSARERISFTRSLASVMNQLKYSDKNLDEAIVRQTSDKGLFVIDLCHDSPPQMSRFVKRRNILVLDEDGRIVTTTARKNGMGKATSVVLFEERKGAGQKFIVTEPKIMKAICEAIDKNGAERSFEIGFWMAVWASKELDHLVVENHRDGTGCVVRTKQKKI